MILDSSSKIRDLNANTELEVTEGQSVGVQGEAACIQIAQLDLKNVSDGDKWEEPFPAFKSWQEDCESGEAQLSPQAARMTHHPLGEDCPPVLSHRSLDFGQSQRFLHDPEALDFSSKALSFTRIRRSSFSSKDEKREDRTPYQLVKKLKGNSNTTHIPIILLTSKNDLDDKIIGLEHGADNYIAKPFHMAELKIMIENILKNRQRIRGKYSGAYQEDKIKEIELESDDEVLMKRIMKVVNDNLDNTELKVEMLSKEIGLSRVQLHRRMKEITGISTGEFIRNIRLKKAAELLSEKKVNVSQVAYMVGFSSHTHFSTAFRKFYGVSPTEYMNRS